MLLAAGYVYVPYSSMEAIIENSKEGYYLALRQTQGTLNTDTPNWHPWVLFFLKALQQQKQRLSVKLEQEQLLLTQLPELALKIVELAKSRGRITIGEVVILTEANRNTVKKHLGMLLNKKLLTKRGVGKGTWYAFI